MIPRVSKVTPSLIEMTPPALESGQGRRIPPWLPYSGPTSCLDLWVVLAFPNLSHPSSVHPPLYIWRDLSKMQIWPHPYPSQRLSVPPSPFSYRMIPNFLGKEHICSLPFLLSLSPSPFFFLPHLHPYFPLLLSSSSSISCLPALFLFIYFYLSLQNF